MWESTARVEIRRAAAFFSQPQQSYDSPRGNRRNRSRGEGRPYRKDGGTRRKLWKQPIRVTKILIGGRGFIWEASTGESSHTREKNDLRSSFKSY